MKKMVWGVIGFALGVACGWAGPLAVDPGTLVASARKQIGVTIGYDPEYRVIPYPGGDVPPESGVCTDVLIRALREQGLDLQRLVHDDMRANFARYPRAWGLSRPDTNIDHRRVPNLMTYLTRQGCGVPLSRDPHDYRTGDVVTWDLARGNLPHIGIISDHRNPDGIPMVIHNIGRGTREEDILFRFRITGHYRITGTVKNDGGSQSRKRQAAETSRKR